MSYSGTCAVSGCSYSMRKLKQFMSAECFEHGVVRAQCECPAPYSLHALPARDPAARAAWLSALKLRKPPKKILVCSYHFVERRPTEEHPNPELFLGYDQPPHKRVKVSPAPQEGPEAQISKDSSSQAGQFPSRDTDAGRLLLQGKSTSSTNNNTNTEPCRRLIPPKMVSVETDLTMQDILALQEDNAALKEYLIPLEAKLKTQEEQLQSFSTLYLMPELTNDRHVKFYTGIVSSKMFFSFIILLSNARAPLVSESVSVKLEEQLLMVLMKLRLRLTNKDLAIRFRTSSPVIAGIFQRWLEVMLKVTLVLWPSIDEIHQSLPAGNKTNTFLKQVRCMVELVELVTDRPSCGKNKVPNSKTLRSFKALVAVSPAGAITFISKVMRGATSDKVVLQSSGLINLLDGGDVVLADSGFTFQEYFVKKDVQLVISDSPREGMEAEEAALAKEVTKARLHMKKSICQLKEFNILQNILPDCFTSHQDAGEASTVYKVLSACAVLVNLSKPVGISALAAQKK